jgi:hypothetical protein
MTNTEKTTNATTASNYAADFVERVPVHTFDMADGGQGPFLHRPAMKLPPTHILTKTHCGGYCDDCPPKSYVFDKHGVDRFYQACRTGHVSNTRGKLIVIPYPTWELIEKAIHLIRDPFDNIVARWHLAMKNRMPENGLSKRKNVVVPEEWLSMANPRSPEGFRAWCRFVDRRDEVRLVKSSSRTKKPWIDTSIRQQMKGVPCAAEWFRYTQWHNLAAAMVTEQNIPTHLLYYESYSTQYNQTVQGILDFLQLPWVRSPVPFVPGKTYHDYYTPSEALAAMQLVKSLATSETWELVRHYFDWALETVQ